MSNNYSLSYNVDLVLCIDCTESMDNVLNIVKEKALSLNGDIQSNMQKKGKTLNRLRVRVVAFRDYKAHDREYRKKLHANEPMLITDFFTLPSENFKLETSVKSLLPVGGGDEPEDGLEALAYAIRSQWTDDGDKNRHVIVLWSDAVPHELGYGDGAIRYPRGMAKNFKELTDWWGDCTNAGYMKQQMAKRLILFTPDDGAWSRIAETWDNIILYPSHAGDGLKEIDYNTILNCIVNTIG